MRLSNTVRQLAITSVSIAVLAGCSGGGSLVPPTPLQGTRGTVSLAEQSQVLQTGRLSRFLGMRGGIVPGPRVTTQSFIDPGAVGQPLVFLSTESSAVDIYLQAGNNKMVGQITGFNLSVDLATDAAGNLYVVDSIAGNAKVFAPPYTNGPKLTLQPYAPQGGIAVSSRGVVGVTACTVSSQQCDQGVDFYAPGSTTPCAKVPLSGLSNFSLGWEAFDHKGSLYVEAANSAGTIVIVKINGGCNATNFRTLTLGNTLTAYPGGIKIDKAGHIAIVDLSSSGATQIDTYDPPSGGSLGNPISATPLVGAGVGPLAFVPLGGHVWLGNCNSLTPFGSKYAYPAGGAPEKIINSNQNVLSCGVAVTPPLVP